MASNNGDFVLDLHPLNGNDFICTITIEEMEESDSIETIIILDQSGSMKRQTARFTNMIIPLVLSILNYEQSKRVHLIAFQKSSSCFYKTAGQFKSLSISSGGGTNLAPALHHLKDLFKSFEADQLIRILTISDGEIGDASNCTIAMREIMEIVNRSHFSINSQAVRLFTSSNQPDTKALCNLTMLNNTTTSSLVDMSCNESDQATARTIANLFLSDKFKCTKSLKFESKIVLKFPWDLEPASEIMLRPGLNLFWLKGVPTVAKIRNAYVKVNKQNQLTLSKFQELMEVKMEYFLDHLKILKVVGTAEANNSVAKILKYFEDQETALARTCSNGQKRISVLIRDIARDENFKNLNSGQMAEYLIVVTQRHKEAAIKFQREQEEQRRKNEEERKRDAERILQEEIRKKAEEEERERIRQEEIRKNALEEDQERIRLEEIRQEALEEEEERIRQEEIRKKALEEEQERIRQEEIRKNALEEEQERIRQEEIRKNALDEEQERIRQEEIRKKALEEEQERIRQEEIRKKALEEEQERIRQEEIRQEALEEEQERIRQEEIRKKALEEEQERIRQEEIRKNALEEEQQRIRQEEIRKKALEEEQERIRQEEIRKKALEVEQERIRQEEICQKASEEEQERIQQEEIRKKEQEEQYRKQLIEEEQRQKEELRKNRLFANLSGRLVDYFTNYKFNFYIIIFIILCAIIELKLQLTSGTGCDL